MPQQDVFPRLQSMCNSFGFGAMNMQKSCSCASEAAAPAIQDGAGQDSVIMLSCKVHYNPNWGSLCGHPQIFTSEKTGVGEDCPSAFLAPFLQTYHLAQQQIYLNWTRDGRFLISAPEKFIKKPEQHQGCTLNIRLDKVARKNMAGVIEPVTVCGARFTYEISDDLHEALNAADFAWHQGRNTCIERHLTPDLFLFSCAEDAADCKSPFFPTLFPYLRELVAHRTPHLRAAEIHLEQEYHKALVQMTADNQATRRNRACIAGVVIDMSPYAGHVEKYFVPWKAYLEREDDLHQGQCSFDQDDLFVRLMQ